MPHTSGFTRNERCLTINVCGAAVLYYHTVGGTVGTDFNA